LLSCAPVEDGVGVISEQHRGRVLQIAPVRLCRELRLEQPLYRFVQWFRGGLVVEAHRLLHHSAQGPSRTCNGSKEEEGFACARNSPLRSDSLHHTADFKEKHFETESCSTEEVVSGTAENQNRGNADLDGNQRSRALEIRNE